jgi:hypothetical protein
MSTLLAATAASAALKHPPDLSECIPACEREKKTASAKIRLVRWFSSCKQVFIAELLVRSTARGK